MDAIRILSVDDHHVIVSGLRSYFRGTRDDIVITDHFRTAEEAIHFGKEDDFDLIMLDLWLHDTEPAKSFGKLKFRFPGKPIVMYTAEKSIHWQNQMFKLGARAYIDKEADKQEIRKILLEVHGGETVYTSAVSGLLKKRDSSGYLNPEYGLTKEHHEVIHWFLQGLSSKLIAEKLKKKNVSSIDTALRKIRLYFDVKNNRELMIFLLKIDRTG